MDWDKVLYNEGEQPLDQLVQGYSYTSVFRTIGFIGDSLSSGEFETRNEKGEPGYHDLYEYSWGQYIARKNGLKGYSFSRGGLTAKTYRNSFVTEPRFTEVWNQENACQAYVMALGVNDVFNQNMEIGSIADIDPEDYNNNKDTFAGNYAYIVSRYKEISPDAKFFFVGIPRKNHEVYYEKGPRFIELLYELAEYFDNAYVIDLYKYGPMHDDKFKEHFYLYGHLNASGYIQTAQMIDSYIDYIVRHNPQDFKEIGLVNSGIPYKL